MSRHKKKSPNAINARMLWERLSVEEWLGVLKSAGLNGAKGQARTIKAKCPAHSERTASFSVVPEDGYAHCFGCGYVTRDPIGLISRTRDIDYAAAATWLSEAASIRVLDKATITEFSETHSRRVHRSRVVERACDLLADAIGLWRDDGPELGDDREKPMQLAGLWVALPTIEWMRERRFGVKPGEAVTPARVRHVWQGLARQRLIGFLPPRVLYQNDDRETATAYDRAFGLVKLEDLGKPIMPWRRVDGTIGQIKLRTLAEGADAIPYTVLSQDDDGERGVYMPAFLVHFLRGTSRTGAASAAQLMAIEGETGVLSIEAQQPEIEIGLAGVVALGGGQGASTDALLRLGVGELRIVGDHTAPGTRKGGHKWVHEVVEDVRVPVSLRVLTWDPAALDCGHGPDDVVRDQGRGVWEVMTQPRAWVPAHEWLATRAAECVPAGATPAKLADVAKEWGSCLRDAQERAAYVNSVATRLGLDGAALRRELDARAEGRYIPRNLSTPTALAREVIRALTSSDGAEPVDDEGSVWRCVDGIWREVDDAAIMREVMALDGVEWGVGEGQDRLEGKVLIKVGDPKGIAVNVRALIKSPGFFAAGDAGGVADAAGNFLRAQHGRIVVERLRPEHRVRWALPVAYEPIGWDPIGTLGAPVGPIDAMPGEKCPRFCRLLFETMRKTFCTVRGYNDVHPCGETGEHVCWPRSKVSPPTMKWAQEWQETIPLMRAVTEAIGVSLLGEATRLERAVLFLGLGGNGKSTLMSILHALAEGTTCTIGPHELAGRFDAAGLVGKRLNIVDEISATEMIETVGWKAVISGKMIKGEHKRKDRFSFAPIAGHFYGANDAPASRDQTRGFWRRMYVVPMPHCYDDDTRPWLADRWLDRTIIETELADIVALALEAGAAALAKGGYTQATQSSEAKRQWREESDVTVAWRADATTATKTPETGMMANAAYTAFCTWAEERGHKRMTETMFGRRMRGSVASKKTERGRMYALQLRPPISIYGERPSESVRKAWGGTAIGSGDATFEPNLGAEPAKPS